MQIWYIQTMDLLSALLRLIDEKPGWTGRFYANELRKQGFRYVTHTDVNRVLYGNPLYFNSNIDSSLKPHWSLTELGRSLLKSSTREVPTPTALPPSIPPSTPPSVPPAAVPPPLPGRRKPKAPQLSEKSIRCLNREDWAYEYPELYKWQIEKFNLWVQEGMKGIVEAVTGTGKTRFAMVAADRFLRCAAQEGIRAKVLIIVPNKVLLHQWEKSINEYLITFKKREYRVGFLGDGYKQSLRHVDILIGISNSVLLYKTLPQDEVGLIIGDEVHHYGTELAMDMLEEEFAYRLGLTAYLERVDDNGVDEVIIPYFGPIIGRLQYAEAIDEGYIAPFRVMFLLVEMTPVERREYEEISQSISSQSSKLMRKYGSYVGGDTSLSDVLKRFRKTDKMIQTYDNTIRVRKSMLTKFSSKLDALSVLYDAIKGSNGTFGFTQTEQLGIDVLNRCKQNGVKSELLTGKTPQEKRQGVMSAFRNHILDMIIAPKLLDEGVDVPSADMAIILGRNTSMRQSIQRIGRVVRRKTDSDAHGNVVIIASKGTIEDPTVRDQETFYEVFGDADITIETLDYPRQKDEIKEILRKWMKLFKK